MPNLQTAAFETARDGTPLTSLTTDVTVYLAHPISIDRDAVFAILERFHALVPKGIFKWYITESMTKDKPCAARTFGIPSAWWREGAARKATRYLQIKDGEAYNSLPTHAVRLSCYELEAGKSRPWEPSSLRFVFPASWAEEKPGVLLEMALLVADRLPIASGHAGLCIERSSYREEAAIRSAYPLAMRFQGIDIDYRLCQAEFEHLKTVNWITIVGDELVARIHGRAAVRARAAQSGVQVHETAHGIVLQAGDRPALGDINRGELLPAYRAAYRCVAGLFAPAFAPAFHLTVPRDSQRNEELTEAWYRRFARGSADAR
jgi:hypothetical protein